jgi:RNA polymerase sigma-70 factor (ECF subfamily)
MVENFHSFRGKEAQFRNWLYRIATNAANQYLRQIDRRKNLLRNVREQTNNGNADCEESPERLALLKEAMLSLKPRYQTIITLRFFENMKLIEIAEVLGSSSGTIRSQLARALTELRAKMNSSGTA